MTTSGLAIGIGLGLCFPMNRGGTAAPSAPVPANYDYLVFGDSRAAFGSFNTYSTSFVQEEEAIGFNAMLAMFSGHRLRSAKFNNFGENGSTTTEMVTQPRPSHAAGVTTATWWRQNDQASGNKSLSDVAAHPAGIVLVIAGTNDGVAIPATTETNLTTMLNSFATAGKVVILFNETPRGIGKNGATTGFLISNDSDRFTLSQWIDTLDYASGSPNARPNVIVVNSRDAILDPSTPNLWRNIAGTTWDGIHLSQYGVRKICQAIVARLSSAWNWASIPQRVILPAAGAPFINSNPTMAPGSAGQVNGTFANAPAASSIAQGWNLVGLGGGAGSITVAPGKGSTNSDGNYYQELVISGTLAAGQQPWLEFRQDMGAISSGTLALTDKVRAVGYRYVAAGSTGLYGVQLDIQLLDGSKQMKSIAAAVTNAQQSRHRDIDGLDSSAVVAAINGFELLQTNVLDLSEPNMASGNGGGGNLTSVADSYLRWTIYLGDASSSSSQTINATVRIGPTGVCKVTS